MAIMTDTGKIYNQHLQSYYGFSDPIFKRSHAWVVHKVNKL